LEWLGFERDLKEDKEHKLSVDLIPALLVSAGAEESEEGEESEESEEGEEPRRCINTVSSGMETDRVLLISVASRILLKLERLSDRKPGQLQTEFVHAFADSSFTISPCSFQPLSICPAFV
jgi:hypothetical protein